VEWSVVVVVVVVAPIVAAIVAAMVEPVVDEHPDIEVMVKGPNTSPTASC